MSDADREQPFISHLVELRSRLLRIVIGILAVFVAMSPFSNPIYTALAGPLTRHMPAQSSMIAIDVLSPFLTPLKFTLVLAVFVTVPWTLYQVWAFVAPGLYQREKRMVLPILASSTLLFYCGMAFAYFVIMPIFFAFITSTAPEGVAVMTDINRYLDFVMTIFFAFGVAFEVPVATVILALAGILSPEAMAAKRPFVIVGAFVIGMLLTPPDVISQTLLAVPMWLLFEIGVFISRLLLRRRGEARATAAATESTRQR
ncbi:MAG: twin-arginine translocase subunit TatC [Candidatus Competibacter sp.]|nr:twin-arginine translocase subunit TatC [Candidatus Competibacter sp.]